MCLPGLLEDKKAPATEAHGSQKTASTAVHTNSASLEVLADHNLQLVFIENPTLSNGPFYGWRTISTFSAPSYFSKEKLVKHHTVCDYNSQLLLFVLIFGFLDSMSTYLPIWRSCLFRPDLDDWGGITSL